MRHRDLTLLTNGYAGRLVTTGRPWAESMKAYPECDWSPAAPDGSMARAAEGVIPRLHSWNVRVLHAPYVSTVSGPGADADRIHCIWAEIQLVQHVLYLIVSEVEADTDCIHRIIQ